MRPPQSNELLVLFVKKEKKNRFRSSWLKTTCIRKAAKYVASAYPWVKLPNPWFPFFLPIYDQIMRVRKKIDLELHLKINVLKIKRYIWCNIVHQSEKKTHSENAEGWNSITVHAKTDFICTSLFKSLWKIRDKKHKYSRKYSIIILACPKTKAQRWITGAMSYVRDKYLVHLMNSCFVFYAWDKLYPC